MSEQKYCFLFVIFVFLFVSAFIFPFDFVENVEAMQRTMDLGHFFGFAGFSWILYRLFFNRWCLNPLPATFIFCLFLILSIELTQPLFFRTASWVDVRNGFCGLFVTFMGVFFWNLRKKRPWVLWAYLLLWLMTFLFVSEPATQAWYAVWWRYKESPLLGDFEKPVELSLWQPTDRLGKDTSKVFFSRKHVVSGINSLKVETLKGYWSGARYLAGSSEWGRFHILKMEIYNPGTPFQLNIRIDDDKKLPQYGERFDTRILLSEGWNSIELLIHEIETGPKTRRLNMNAIHKMTIFTSIDETHRVFYLDHVRLAHKVVG